jgi:hypothetical protein
VSGAGELALRPGRWPAGVSGNPAGKAPGTKNLRRPGVRELLRDVATKDAPGIIRTLRAAARAGNVTAAGVLLVAIVGNGGEAGP